MSFLRLMLHRIVDFPEHHNMQMNRKSSIEYMSRTIYVPLCVVLFVDAIAPTDVCGKRSLT